MKCASCEHDNPDQAKFCLECGSAFPRNCSECGTPLPEAAKFCLECGTAIRRPNQTAAVATRNPLDYTPKHLADKILRSKSVLEGERKQVTVLFADVQGSMDLAEQVGPERWHAILDRFFQILTDGVHRFEGTVNQYTGDGIMALFGAPLAHEDHAQRACFAALQLRDAVRAYADELRRSEGVSLSARIGLNSGEVIVGRIGDDLRMDYTAQGHTVGLAQRMEARAAADSTYLTENTARLVEGYFVLRDLGEFDLKGSSEPIRGFELEGIGAASTRLDRSRARGFAKFVGRDREMEALDNALEEAIAGNGQVMGVVAEAGTGKSRLCAEFVDRCRARGIRVNAAHCPAHGKNIPHLPFFEFLRDIFELRPDDSDHEARRKIAGELTLLDDKFQTMLPLLFDFLGVSDPAKPPLQLSPEAREQQLYAFVRDLPEARSRESPNVLLLDDLHWIDPGSDAFLAHSVNAVPDTHTLWLVNFRPEYHAEWMTRSYYRQIPLRPLGREAIDELLRDLLGADPSLANVAERVYDRTAGNPFFVEEVVQSLVESGSLAGERGAYRLVAPIEALVIPDTVQSVLSARIDRLPEREKRTLQTASVIDKEFPLSILARVTELSGAELTASLAELVQAEFLLEKQLYPEAEYGFKHPLTQEVAYTSLLENRRAQLHAAVARTIEDIESEKLDESAALLAHHWEVAGEHAIAAGWHARAARAAGLDSPAEAMRHWERAWDILARESDEGAHDALRVEAASMILRGGLRQGITAERADEIFAEGKRLAEQQNDPGVLVGLLYGYGVSAHLLGGRNALSVPVFEEAIAIADRSGDPELRWAAREPIVAAYNYLGRLDLCEAPGREMIEICNDDPCIDMPVTSLFSGWGYAQRGWTLTDLGRYAEADECFVKAEIGARALGRTEQHAWSTGMNARACARSGDVDAALGFAKRSVSYAEDVGSHLALVCAYGHHGTALTAAGEWAAAIDRLEQALEICRTYEVWVCIEGDLMAYLAEALLGAGRNTEALQVARGATEEARAAEGLSFELHAQLALARVLISTQGAASEPEASAALDVAQARLEESGARSYSPMLLEERARLASALSDPAAADTLRRDAHREYVELGATGQAERLSRQFDL